MADVTPVDIQRHLGGIEYPASKQDIIDQARASDADETVMSRLETLPDRTFNGPDEVTRELGGTT